MLSCVLVCNFLLTSFQGYSPVAAKVNAFRKHKWISVIYICSCVHLLIYMCVCVCVAFKALIKFTFLLRCYILVDFWPTVVFLPLFIAFCFVHLYLIISRCLLVC